LHRKGLAVGILILMLGVNIGSTFAGDADVKAMSSVGFDGNTLYVGGSGPNNYTRIQDAVDDAVDGDTVFVYDDSSPYSEHLNIMKSIMIIGENKDMTKIYGAGEIKDILFILSRNVTVINFTIQYATNLKSGILIKDSSYVTIMDCKFSNIPSMDAVTVSNSDNILINNCLMAASFDDATIDSTQNDRYISGITLEGNCINTTISRNTISHASYAGIIILKDCLNTRVTGNYIHSNDLYGIRVQYSNSTTIMENSVVKNHEEGIAILYCDNTHISGNTIEDNGRAGVGVAGSTNTLIIRNNFIHNGFIGNFAFNLGNGFENRINCTWNENYWGRSRILPKPLFGIFIFQRDTQTPFFIIPWFMFDWHPAKEPYDIGGGYNEQ